MKSMKQNPMMRVLFLTWLAMLVPACAGAAAPARIEPAAAELGRAVSAKLGRARTIRVRATHEIRPAPGLGGRVDIDRMEITVERPNRFYSIHPAGAATTEIAYDGRTLCVMNPGLKHHAIEGLQTASIEEFADAADRRFGFRPPVAELLAKDVSAQLFVHATSARVVGREWVGWTRCDRLRIEQAGMTGDLLVGVKDKLPRRLLLTFATAQGPSTWNIRLARWELNVPVDATLFSKRPAADSLKVKMIRSR